MPRGAITGRIVDEFGVPVRNFTVVLVERVQSVDDSADWFYMNCVKTGPDGTHSLTGVDAGAYRIESPGSQTPYTSVATSEFTVASAGARTSPSVALPPRTNLSLGMPALTAPPVVTGTTVDISWTAVAGATSHDCREGDGAWVKTTGTSATLTGLAAGSNLVEVRAANAEGVSPMSGATGYEVYRATFKSGTYKRVTTTTSRSFTNTSLTTAKRYYYKVRAYRVVSGRTVYGTWSAIVSAVPTR